MRNYKIISIVLVLCSFYMITAYADVLEEIIKEDIKLNREQVKTAEKMDNFLKTGSFEKSADKKSSGNYLFYKLAASGFFSLIGFVFFVYWKKNSAFTPMVIGVALMAYPYFVSNLLLLCGIGIVLIIIFFIAHRYDIGF